jgi:hypothetical protein
MRHVMSITGGKGESNQVVVYTAIVSITYRIER